MTRYRSFLFCAALAALLLSVTPASAGSGSPGVASGTAAPATAPSLDAGRCTQPAVETALAPAPGLFLAAPPSDFILCSCSYCKHHPDVVCRISPSGFSILCSDYYTSRCI